MYRVLLVTLLLPLVSWGYTAVETDISQPYEIFPIEATAQAQIAYLGSLENYPVMYEVTSDEPFTFNAFVSQSTQREIQPLSLLLIRKNDRGGGVAEVARMSVDTGQWQRTKDSLLGMTFVQSPSISEEVSAGTYRIEVSSPDNQGRYLLQIGNQPTDQGYLTTLSEIRTTQKHFGLGLFSILKSSYVYYPLGILVLLFAFYKTWQYSRKRRAHA